MPDQFIEHSRLPFLIRLSNYGDSFPCIYRRF